MASDTGNTFGFELLYKVSGGQVVKKEDVLILLVHWYFTKNEFKCLGTGDSKIIGPNETGSELLPDNWNQGPTYSLRYVKEGKLYILVGIRSDADLLINLLRIEDHSVSNVQFPIDTAKELQGPLATLIPTYDTVINTLKKDLIEPVYSGTEGVREISTQTQTERHRDQEQDDPLRVGPPRCIYPGSIRADPMAIGRNDLDPFQPVGPAAGGMIFDPFVNRGSRPQYPGLGVPGRLPHGAVPPGARFDPFGPPDVNPPIPRARVPDADHMPPPGYDDMFM